MSLTIQQRNDRSTVADDRSGDAVVTGRARMVLWRDEGYTAEQAAALARGEPYHGEHVGAATRRRAWLACTAGPGRQAGADAGRGRARILALTRTSPLVVTGLTRWSSPEMAGYLAWHEGIRVSHNFI